MTHPFGRSLDMFVNYQLQYQTDNIERLYRHRLFTERNS